MSNTDKLRKFMDLGDPKDEDCSDALKLKVKDFYFLKYMYEHLGGFTAAVNTTKIALTASQKLFKNSPRYQKTVQTLNSIIPLAMTGIEIGSKAKDFFTTKMARDKPYVDEENIVLSTILDVEGQTLRDSYFNLDDKIIDWVLELPKTNSFIVEGVIDNKWNIVDKINMDNDWVHYFIIRADKIRFVLKMQYDSLFDTFKWIRVYHTDSHPVELRLVFTYSYIESLDFNKNIIVLKSKDNLLNVTTLPRQVIKHDVYQLEDKFFTELKKSLKKKKKRGYGIVGRPGVGKTTIVNKIVDEIRDVPVIVIPADSSSSSEDIMKSLIICQLIAPCMVIFEDIDMLPMKHKDSSHLSTFIEYLDSAKFNAPVIFMATLNEPELIHESLMDRRGRFDKVVVVQPPSTPEEITEVLSNVYAREYNKDFPDILNEEFFSLSAKNELRHSDFTEVINRMLINDLDFTIENLLIVLKDMCNTQNIVDDFKNRKTKSNASVSISDIDILIDKGLGDNTLQEYFKNFNENDHTRFINTLQHQPHRSDCDVKSI